MALGVVSTDSVDYLQRVGALPPLTDGTGPSGAPATRRILRIRGLGRTNKHNVRDAVEQVRWRPATAGLITGMYGYRIPLAFAVTGTPAGVSVEIGTWSAREADPGVQDRRLGVVESVLRGLYPLVRTEGHDFSGGDTWPLCGLALGTPAPTGIDRADGSAPIDRVIRSMTGTRWAALTLAYPVAEAAVNTIRRSVLNEIRSVQATVRAEGATSPLADQYVELLGVHLALLGEGLATGAWRTATYLMGDHDSYPRLASVWRSVFSGERSLPEPVRVYDRPEVAALVAAWSLPDQAVAPGPGGYARPFEFQTLLNSVQLAACVHLPDLETPGFSIEEVPQFDADTARPGSGTELAIGRILHQRRDTGLDYRVPLVSLTRHAFVAGLTGSGKTNTIFSLLDRADQAGVPFLVIEPAKTEYRALLDHPRLGPRMRVFTAGKSTVGPFLINPFEVPPGTAVSEHLDLLRAVFAAAFGMWTPLPQILERCLYAVYADRGWDLRTNENSRLRDGGDRTLAFPTLADLVVKLEEVIPALGYDERVAGDLRAALSTRLESLRSGGKGAMFDVARSLPIADLLAQPTVIELEALGDDGDKAFLMGLLLIRLVEHRRAAGQTDSLVHLLVVEEAHRLLANVSTQAGEGMANPRGQAVEAFTNLLSEIRAYGQGVIIADQVPVRLAPDVMKNTNLKIAHRIVSLDDRYALAGAMAMDEAQARALTTLAVGESVVFSAGDDAPIVVQVPLAKDPLAPTPPRDDVVAARMSAWRQAAGVDGLFRPRPFCVETCTTATACTAARQLMADDYVRWNVGRAILSTIEESGALDRGWDELLSLIRPRRPYAVHEADLLRSFAGHAADWYAQRRGNQNAWSYTDTERLGDVLRAVLLDKVAGSDPVRTGELRAALRTTAHRLHARQVEPYPVCADVCDQDPPLCLYRSAVADVVTSRRHRAAWREADATDVKSAENRRTETWEVCQDAAFEVVEFPGPDTSGELKELIVRNARRVCICFEQQMLADDTRKLPRTSRRILARVLAEAGI